MRNRISQIIRVVFIAVVSVIVVSGTLGAVTDNMEGRSYTVIATVAPARYIIVDDNLQIVQIVSNTKVNVRPSVLLDSLDGQDMPYTSSVREQYQSLKPTLDFSKAGVVYAKEHQNPISHAFQNIFSILRRLIN